jgi:hypothetical protein
MGVKCELVTDLYCLIDEAGAAEQEVACRITYTFQPGRPAYTPRGEYAPIDPPEPDAVEDVTIEVMAGEDDLRRPIWEPLRPRALHDKLAAQYEQQPEGLIEHAKERVAA